MKTQNSGVDSCRCPPDYRTWRRVGSVRWSVFGEDLLLASLKNYIENRENGAVGDRPSPLLPTSGLERCDNPYKEFDWEADKVRGYPTKDSRGNNKRYWYILKHKQSGKRITGFYEEPDYGEGHPDCDGNYWWKVVFTDTENDEIRNWMEEKDENYLNRIRTEDPELYKEEIKNHPDHPPVVRHLAKLAEIERRQQQEQQQIDRLQQELEAMRLAQQQSSAAKSPLSQHQINFADLVFNKKLAEGSFGEVWDGQWLRTPVAIKKPHGDSQPVSDVAMDELFRRYRDSLEHEATIMADLNHPNIVKFYGLVKEPTLYVVMELMHLSLEAFLSKNSDVSWSLRFKIAMDVARGLHYLHHKAILHRDLKSPNVLLDEANRAKLSDYGTSKYGTSYSTQSLYSPFWVAPELLVMFNSRKKVDYTQACDVYSFAIVLWELAARQMPKPIQPAALIRGTRQQIPENTPKSMQALIESCWHAQANKRLTMAQVIEYLDANPITEDSSGASSGSSGASSSSSSSSTSSSSSSGGHATSSSRSSSSSTPSSRGSFGRFFATEEEPLPDEPDDDELCIMKAKHAYRAKESNQLSFLKGDELTVIDNNGKWWYCEQGGRRGLVPSNYLEPVEASLPAFQS